MNEIAESTLPQRFVLVVEEGIRESLESGVLAGYRLVDLRATLVDADYDEEESTDLAFKVAASMALREGVDKAAPVLLEPMMKVEAVAPDEFSGAIIGDLSARGGQIEGKAMVPLANVFGYATDLRSMSQGRGTFTLEFDHYDKVVPEVLERILMGGFR